MDVKANQIREMKILEEELKSTKMDSKVYTQQQNSGIFFRTTKDKAFEKCKKTLDNLVEEYKEMEGQRSGQGSGLQEHG